MNIKIFFDEITKIITIIEPPIDNEIFIDVKEDLYSAGKREWVIKENLRKFMFPISACGGNPLPQSNILKPTFILASDWRIRPYEANHRLVIYGDLHSYNGSDFFLDTLGTYKVTISILRQ